MIKTNLGWECPKCGRCYSPLTPTCFTCTGHVKSNITTGTSTGTSTLGYHNFVDDGHGNCLVCSKPTTNHPVITYT